MPRRLRSRTLVARAAELAAVDRLRASAAAGCGGLAVVLGEPGVGKSRLLAEVADRARAAGSPVLAGRSVEGGGAYRPLADALLARSRAGGLPPASAVEPFAGSLARLVPGWARVPDDDAVADLPLLVSEGLLRVLSLLDGTAPPVLVLDDLHWADADTLTVLDRLADALATAPLLVVLASRRQGPAVLDRLVARADELLALRRLGEDDAAALADACSDGAALPEHVRRHVVEHADGLPFLVEEILGGLVDSGALVRTAAGWEAPAEVHGRVPASFSSVVRARLTGLEADAQHVVETAAVLGRSFDWRLLVRVTGLPDATVLQALRVAVERGLTEPDGDEPDVFRFVHALTRETVVAGLLPPQRAALARAAAAVVEDSGTDPELASSLHAQAGERRRAAGLLLQAAAVAAGGALGTREDLLRRARALAPDDPDVTLALVQVLALAGRGVEARELGDPLLRTLPPGDARRTSLALVLARACLLAARSEDALGYLEHAGSGPAVDALAAHVAFARSRPDEAAALASAASGAADPAVRCEALEMVGRVARLRDRREQAAAAFRRALAVADDHGLAVWRARALSELGTLDLLGPARSERLVEARQQAVRAGLVGTAAVLDLQLAAVHALRMDHPATLAAALRGRGLAEQLRLPALAGANLVFVATAHGHTGRTDEMHATLDEAEQRLVDDVDQLAAARCVRGTPALLAHDLDAWRTSLHDGVRLMRRNASASPSPYRGLLALLETVLGDGADERDDLRASGATVQACNRGALAYADAVATARDGRDPAARVAEADAVLEPLVWRRHHLRLLAAPAALRDGWGQPVEWLREALAHFEAVGDAGLARACREQLRVSGLPVPRRGRGTTDVPEHLRRLGVTSREVDVLCLVAAGLPNATVAARLFLSPRTVETHVASLLAKTGASGRAALASYAPTSVDPRG